MVKKVVVVGGTGRQGGSLIKALLAHERANEFEIFALTRDASSEAAKTVAASGVKLLVGNCLDVASLEAAFKDADFVFFVTNPFATKFNGKDKPVGDPVGEIKQGKNVVDAALKCSVRHLIFSSAAGLKDGADIIPTFNSKLQIEEYLVSRYGSNKNYTIFGVTGYFDNLVNGAAGIKKGSIPSLIKKDVKAQMVAVADLGHFFLKPILSPEEWQGKRFEIAGDKISAEDMLEVIKRVRKEQDWKISVIPELVLILFVPKAVGALRDFLVKKGTNVDIEACRKVYPVRSFEQWFVDEGYDTYKFPVPESRCTVM